VIFCFGLPQRLVVWPLAWLLPRKRIAIVGNWFYLMAQCTIGLARFVADVRIRWEGAVPAGPCVVLMNHQSLLDIPIAYRLVRHPYPLVPTRTLYARGIPGVSPLVRMGRLPLIGQTKESQRRDLKEMAHAAEQVASGSHSLAIFPEGHRTKDGEISPFMPSGLRIILSRARERPVYLIVVDGFWHARTTSEALFTFAGTRGRAKVVGPFSVGDGEIEPFVAAMEEKMRTILVELRAEPRAELRA
jgi:1-acyl-sn-glycerol-3-phosphate acyltransferase